MPIALKGVQSDRKTCAEREGIAWNLCERMYSTAVYYSAFYSLCFIPSCPNCKFQVPRDPHFGCNSTTRVDNRIT
jgi:hypothetical protein